MPAAAPNTAASAPASWPCLALPVETSNTESATRIAHSTQAIALPGRICSARRTGANAQRNASTAATCQPRISASFHFWFVRTVCSENHACPHDNAAAGGT